MRKYLKKYSRIPSAFIEYENEKFILINKPSGIAVHSGTNQKFDFLSSLRSVYKQNELSLVHRLDKSYFWMFVSLKKVMKSASYLGKSNFRKRMLKKILCIIDRELDKEIIEIESKGISKDVVMKEK